ncbi:MAG: hypothetical protein HQL53_00935 [Magnetococcales bacterium]|nr:hypothetical protein [Magnetococcales bacterium]
MSLQKIGFFLLLAALAEVWFLAYRLPDASRPPPQFIDHTLPPYEVEWQEKRSHHIGAVRVFERSGSNAPVPLITHHIVLGTGDFAHAEWVRFHHMKEGIFARYWRAGHKPKRGKLITLHLVPVTEKVLDDMMKIRKGDRVIIQGRQEVDGIIRGDEGRSFSAQPSGPPSPEPDPALKLPPTQELRYIFLVEQIVLPVRSW